MHEAQTNLHTNLITLSGVEEKNNHQMKTLTLFFTIFFCLFFVQVKSQTELYNSIQVNTIANNYTVTAENDTTFAREVVISNIDTLNFKKLNASLSYKTENEEWVTLQTTNLLAPNNSFQECFQTLCFYKRNSNVWVLFLGNYSLLSKHKIVIYFETQNQTPVNYDWSNEF